MRTVIVARTRRQADGVRRTLRLRWRDTRCIGTARTSGGLDGCYPDQIITVAGWERGRAFPETAAMITGIVAKRPAGAVSVVSHSIAGG